MTRLSGEKASSVGFQMATMMDALSQFTDVPKVIKKVGWIKTLQLLRDAFTMKDSGLAIDKLRTIFGGSRAMSGALYDLGSGLKDINKMLKDFNGAETELEKKVRISTQGLFEQQFKFLQLM